MTINKKHKSFILFSHLTLGTGTNDINLLKETVSFKIGNYTAKIPAGSFRKVSKVLYIYLGKINPVKLEVSIASLGKNRYTVQAAGAGYHFNDLKNPAIVTLNIGDDNATASIKAIIK